MLFLTLKSLLMILPQSACFHILKDRLVSASRFRQSVLCTPRIMIGGGALGKAAGMGENTSATAGEGKHEDDAKDGTAINTNHGEDEEKRSNGGNRGNGGNDGMSQAERETHAFVSRVQEVRMMHYEATWQTIRAGSLEVQLQEAKTDPPNDVDGGDGGNGRFDDIDNALELDLDDDGDHNDVDDDDDSNLGGINIDLDDAINVDVDLDDGLDATAQSAIPTGRINDPVGVVQPAVDDKSWKQFWTDSNAA
uniref:BSD domain-containing protein n=1 Tax=Craspedostauros australis TaxID=1486917 RepID=A0A7R9WMY5_9STRA